MIKNLAAMQETWVRSLGWEESLEKEMATHSDILAWRIPWTEELSGQQFMGSQRVRHKYSSLYMSIPVSQLSLLPLSAGNHKFVFYICNSVSVWYISSFVPFFKDYMYK